MKYAIIIPDGCADLPTDSLGGQTPMRIANTPNLDALAKTGIVGRSNNVPPGMPPGSDVATLGLLGFYPLQYYTGRAPLEAAAQGIEMSFDDWAIRCNLVHIEDGIMKSFTAGHVSTENAAAFIDALNETVVPYFPFKMLFYTGVSYRNLMLTRSSATLFSGETKTYPPHDWTDKPIRDALPTGPGSEHLLSLMDQSRTVFSQHPVNRQLLAEGRIPISQVWLWGQGQCPNIPTFSEHFHRPLKGAMISAVDLLKGIAAFIGWENIAVPGITGYMDTDYAAKGQYAANALKDRDIVCVHVEAPDEAGHEGDARKKIQALEDIDRKVLPPILDALRKEGDWRILVSPDHPTPCSLKTHTSDYVPWLMAGSGINASEHSANSYDEESARNSQYRFDNGWEMMETFISEIADVC